jgi:hypothetical protein
MAEQSESLREMLSRLEGDANAITVARRIIGSRAFPVTAIRDDILGNTVPERVEALLAKATRTDVFLQNSEIIAYFDDPAILGPGFMLRPVRGEWALRLREVRVDRRAMVAALAAAGCRVRGARLRGRQPETERRQARTRAPAQRRRHGPRSTADKIRDAGGALIADGHVPGETVPWGEFVELLWNKAGVKPETRGYGLDTIQNALRPILNRRRAGS